jgi:hypothetical protein
MELLMGSLSHSRPLAGAIDIKPSSLQTSVHCVVRFEAQWARLPMVIFGKQAMDSFVLRRMQPRSKKREKAQRFHSWVAPNMDRE